MPPVSRQLLRSALRLLLSLTFKKISIVGAGRIPAKGPLLLIGASRDSALDPLLALWASPRELRCPVGAGLFKGKTRAAFLRRLGLVPGRQPSAPEGRAELVAWCVHMLVAGEALVLFLSEEGRDSPVGGPEIAAEVLQEAQARGLTPALISCAWTGGPRFPMRGRGAVLFSSPRVPDQDAREPASFVRAQLADVRAVSREDFAWNSRLELLEKAAILVNGAVGGKAPASDPEGAPKGSWEKRCRWAWLEFPLQFERLLREAGDFFGLLGALGIGWGEPPQGEIRIPDGSCLRLLFVIGGLPAALYGWIFQALPLACSSWLAKEWAAEKGKSYGAVIIKNSVLVFPLCYGLELWALWSVFGGLRSALFVAAALPAGLWALLYAQVTEGFLRTLRALLRFRLPGRLQAELRQRQLRLACALDPLLWLYRS